MDALINKFFNYFIDADKNGALQFIDEWAKENSYKKALEEIVEPALQKFGVLWSSEGDVNLAQGYISAKITEEVLMRISNENGNKVQNGSIKGVAVIGNIEDDYHALGRKMVYNFLVSSGWKVTDLGNDVLAEEFVDMAAQLNADVIGASAMMYSNAKNMVKIRDELDARKLSGKIKFAVGGAIFNLRPKLVNEINADGTAPNAFAAVDLFNKLKEEIKGGK